MIKDIIIIKDPVKYFELYPKEKATFHKKYAKWLRKTFKKRLGK